MNFINGKWVQGSLEELSVRSPSSGEILFSFAQAGVKEVEEAVRSASRMSREWASFPIAEREAILIKYAQLLEENKADIAACISAEAGKPAWEAATEVGTMIGKIALSIKAHHQRCDSFGQGPSITRFKPHGVLAVFGPFNFPGHLANGHIVPALLAGNTIVFKPSEMTPTAGKKMVELLNEAGIPQGVVNLVQGGKETGIALAEHPMIDGLLFTGSAQTGDFLRESFAHKPEKMLALELGGNNPYVVWDIENIEAALALVVQSAFVTAGQRCTCARRLIVQNNEKADQFIQRLVETSQQIVVGTPESAPTPFMGPVISEKVALSLLTAQKNLQHQGGKSLLEMKHLQTGTGLLSPGIMDVTEIENRLDEEYFGPFLQVIRVDSLESAIDEANNTSYGLASGILTDDFETYERFYHGARAGLINWNHALTGASGAAPFGGIGKSGNHRPSAYFAADYCSYAVASLEKTDLEMPGALPPGLKISKEEQ